MNKRQKISRGMDNMPDDIAGHIMSFCDNGRYLTTGLINKQFNSLHKKEERVTTTLGYIESDTPLLGEDGKEILPDTKTLNKLMTSKCMHHLIKRNVNKGLEWDHFCVVEAAEAGYEEFFVWLNDTDLFWLPSNAFAEAARIGNIDIMKFMVKSGYGFPDSCAITIAERNGHQDIIDWFETDVKNTKKYRMYRAIDNYNWRGVEELYDDIDSHYEWMLNDAILTGCFKCVSYLVTLGEFVSKRNIATAEKLHRDLILGVLLENEITL